MILTCTDLSRAFPDAFGSCCDSCHEDDELGYELIECEPPEKGRRPSRHVRAYICCQNVRMVNLLTRDQWAFAVRLKRKEALLSKQRVSY